jgi:hypothetical protein
LDTTDLLQFLRDAHRRGYAAGQTAPTMREDDHSTTIVYQCGEGRFHDNYFGGEPYGGRAVVFLNERPVWMAVYHGRVEDPGAEVQSVYSFLQRALLLAPDDLPFRGPDHFTDELFTYRNARRGDVQNFSGEEIIDHRGQSVYVARYAGGLVDQRGGD